MSGYFCTRERRHLGHRHYREIRDRSEFGDERERDNSVREVYRVLSSAPWARGRKTALSESGSKRSAIVRQCHLTPTAREAGFAALGNPTPFERENALWHAILQNIHVS